MSAHFTDRELDVMKVLWRHGPATVGDVRRKLDDELRNWITGAFTRTPEQKTVLTCATGFLRIAPCEGSLRSLQVTGANRSMS